jgi:hypothetical protein
LICDGANGITHASIVSSSTPELKNGIILNVTIDNSPQPPPPPVTEVKVRFPNRPTDSLKTLGLGMIDTNVGLDIQKYMLNISPDQAVPQWRVDPHDNEIHLYADNITELDLIFIKPLLMRWPQIKQVSYVTKPAIKPVYQTQGGIATYPFVYTVAFSFDRKRSSDFEGGDASGGEEDIEDDEVVIAEKNKKLKRHRVIETVKRDEEKKSKWGFGFF